MGLDHHRAPLSLGSTLPFKSQLRRFGISSRVYPSASIRKAVPKVAAPSILWRACSAEVAPFITQQVNNQWSREQLHIEQDWANATVALLPKPKGKNDKPLDWRPIGLQHPVGKGLMGNMHPTDRALQLLGSESA